jgi:hypothetical protein
LDAGRPSGGRTGKLDEMSMVKALLRAIAVIVVVATSVPASASDAEKRFAIKGAGAAPCSAFIKAFDERNDDALVFAGWLTGYVTALNQELPETFDLAPWQSMDVLMLLMRDLCGRDPEEKFYRVAGGLVRILARDRLTTLSELTEISHEGKTASVPKGVVRQVQERLQGLGLYSGGIDGDYGPGTRQAIEAFQKQRNIPVTGIPDQQTLVEIMYQPERQQAQ